MNQNEVSNNQTKATNMQLKTKKNKLNKIRDHPGCPV